MVSVATGHAQSNGSVLTIKNGIRLVMRICPNETSCILQNNKSYIWRLDEGEIAHIPATMPNAFKNQIAWSPDSQSLIYLQTELDC